MSLVLLDLEGTLHDRLGALPGASEALEALGNAGMSVRFTTNNDSRTPVQLAERLTRFGLKVDPTAIHTPAVALREELIAVPRRCRFFVARAIADDLAPWAARDGIDAVVLGDVRKELDYALLDEAYGMLLAGAELVALQRSTHFLGADRPHLDTGALVCALEAASGLTARCVGKPEASFLQAAMASSGSTPQETVVVGDDPRGDLSAAAAAGMLCVLVRTGKFDPDAVASASCAPDRIVDGMADVAAAVEELMWTRA